MIDLAACSQRFPDAILSTCWLDKENEQASPVLWVHLRSDAQGALEIMRDLGLQTSVIEALTANETRPRTLVTDTGTIVYLRGINKNPHADPEDMVSLRLWLTESLVVTTRKKDRKLLSVVDVKESIDNKTGPKTTGELLCALVEKIADRISETVDDIDDSLTALEEQVSEGTGRINRQSLSLLRRQSASIRRYLAPQRDALDTLYRTKKLLSDAQAFELREQTDRMTRYVEDLDLARERSVVLQEELRNQVAEQQGMRMYVLSMVTAIFLPLSFLTGVFGMNVAGLPGTQEPNAFTYLALGMLTIAVVSIALMIWRKWL